MPRIPLVVICSPTATGKTRLAIELAEAVVGEIVNADSLQVYRYLDIGTAKPTRAERERVTHHLIDVVDPDGEFNAAIYAEQARTIIEKLAGVGKPVFVVGGTGLYIRALLQGIIATPPVDESIRNYYREIRDRHGKEYLFGLLRAKRSAGGPAYQSQRCRAGDPGAGGSGAKRPVHYHFAAKTCICRLSL